MEKRTCGSVIFFCERHLGKSIGCGSGEFAIAVVGEHFLQIRASARNAMEVSIAFAEREVSVRPLGAARIIVEIFLIFRSSQVVKLASEQAVRVIELTLS